MKPISFRNRWVLVTGASSGLGRAMATVLARDHGAHILAVARRADRLEELKRELEAPGFSQVEVLVADLSKLADADRVLAVAKDGRELVGAVLNAGVTHFGPFEELSWRDFETMLDTNVRATVRLCTELIPALEKHPDGGGVLLVSSMQGVTPVPFQSAYSATKAFLATFGTCLWYELRGRNASITTYAPGGIATEMTAGARFGSLRGWLMDVDVAAREGVEAFRRRKQFHVPGVTYRLGAALIPMLPRRLVGGALAAVYGRALHKAG